MCFKAMLSLIYREYDYHPTFYQALKQIIFGLIVFSLLFILHQQWIAKIHSIFYRKKLVLSHVMEISVLVNSSLFAIFVCIISVAGKLFFPLIGPYQIVGDIKDLLKYFVLEIFQEQSLCNYSIPNDYFLTILTVIQEYRKSVMYDRHPIIRHCMSFGVSYFIYDIIAMFVAFQQKFKESNGKFEQ